jgi:hypothetical protein
MAMFSVRRRAVSAAFRRVSVTLCIAGLVASTTGTAAAHNTAVHSQMTDLAYEIMLSASTFGGSSATDQAYAASLTKAAHKLGALPSGLPQPATAVCSDGAFKTLTGSATATWTAQPLAGVPAQKIGFPIGTDFGAGPDCGIDAAWTAGAFYANVNKGFASADHTGTVLGFWATKPDGEIDEIHVYFRPINAAGLGAVKKYVAASLGATAATVYVPIQCFASCTESILTFGLAGDCKKCIDSAIATATGSTNEVVSEIDGLVPGFGDTTSSNLTGACHHIDVVQPVLGQPWQLGTAKYDDKPGMLVDSAGPQGIPDSIEIAVTAVTDLAGMSVHYDPSTMPKRYQIAPGNDSHPDTIVRSSAEWEDLSFPHTPMTPVDNLAKFGWDNFRTNPTTNLHWLGWPLHAIEDATVPMHVAGTFGWGHRPYEDSVQDLFSDIRNQKNSKLAQVQAGRVVLASRHYHDEIVAWRATHGATDIPIRDLVTELAQHTLARATQSNDWPFNPNMSTTYLTNPGTATLFYDNFPEAVARNTPFIEDGLAVAVAFLAAATDGLP